MVAFREMLDRGFQTRMARTLWGLGFAAFVALTPAPAHAQPAVPPPAPTAKDAADAKRHFEVGLKLYAERAFPEALAEFEASYRLGGRPSALKNIAQCHRDMKHFADAYETYARMLAVHDAQLAPAEKAVIRSTLEELAVLTASLKIAVSEEGADVDVDGKSIGTSPVAAPKRVSLGGHKVRVTKSGFEPFEKEVSASSEQALDVTAALEKEITTGSLAVREQDGNEAHVFVDGEDKGAAPWEGTLAPGDHVLELRGQKFASERRPFRLARKEKLDLVVDATSTMAHLRILTVPSSASIKVDGKPLGTGAWEGEVEVGSHQIEVSEDGYGKALRSISVLRGQSLVQEIPLIVPGGGSAPDYRGVYARFNLLFALSPNGGPYEAPSGTPVSAEKGAAVGAGAALRIGYNFDVIGVEFVSSFLFSHYQQHLSYSMSGVSDAKLTANAPSVFLGVGPRITSKDSTVRFTFGLAPGLVIRSVFFDRNDDGGGSPTNQPLCGGMTQTPCVMTTGDTGFHATTGYVAPAFSMDGGLLIGSTPGTKFFLGLHGTMDFPPSLPVGPDTTSAAPNADFQVAGRGYIAMKGPQFYFGPTLGLQFGH